MVSLLIRNLDPAVHAALKTRAAQRRHSLEEEARRLLGEAVERDAAGVDEDIVAIADRFFGASHGVRLEIPPRSLAPGRPPPALGDDRV